MHTKKKEKRILWILPLIWELFYVVCCAMVFFWLVYPVLGVGGGGKTEKSCKTGGGEGC